MKKTRFEKLYCSLFPILKKKLHRGVLDPEELQDIAQEALIRLWQSGIAEQEQNKLVGWLCQTGIRLSIDLARHKQFIMRMIADRSSIETEEPYAADMETRALAADYLRKLFKKVPRYELEVAIMSRFHKVAHKEIAQALEISERTVRRMLERFDERVNILNTDE